MQSRQCTCRYNACSPSCSILPTGRRSWPRRAADLWSRLHTFCAADRTPVRARCGPRRLRLRRSSICGRCAIACVSRSHSSKLARHLVGRAPTALGQRGWVAAVWGGRLAVLGTAQMNDSCFCPTQDRASASAPHKGTEQQTQKSCAMHSGMVLHSCFAQAHASCAGVPVGKFGEAPGARASA